LHGHPALQARSIGLARAGLATAVVFAAFLSTAAFAAAKTLYVSTKGNDANPCTSAHPCKTIDYAIGKAAKGDTVLVEKGTYSQYVLIKKDLKVVGSGHPTLNAKGRANGFVISGPKAAGSTVSGFTIKGATYEGILVEKTSHITISGNTVTGNDVGIKAAKPTGECAAAGPVPGDCGEGLHLMSVTHSVVTGNTVKGNLGGILLTDELGPTADNTISHNTSTNNLFDCGITLAGHNPKATANGKPQPKLGGIYANKVLDNVVNGNGTKGEGAGIIMAGGAPGAGVYNNLVQGNSATGNGLAGVEIHSHFFGPGAPSADLNGNRIIDNKLTHNGLNDKSDAEFSPADFAKGATVGILVGSDVVKLTGIVITGNTVSDSHFGIWTKNVSGKVSATKNAFKNVSVKVKQV
jgi:parallel beta-helix repeat protein